MRGDIEIVEHLVESMLKSADELEKTIARNKPDSTVQLKKQILGIHTNLSEELK
jgi:hypothetical protein